MELKHHVFPTRDLIVVDASGLFDLQSSKRAIRRAVSEPEHREQFNILADLRDATCDLSTVDVYEIAAQIASPGPPTPPRRKVAVLVTDNSEFDHAQFLALCAQNRGVTIEAFVSLEEAQQWLSGAA